MNNSNYGTADLGLENPRWVSHSSTASAAERSIFSDLGLTPDRGTNSGFGFPGAEDLGNVFQFKCSFQEVFSGSSDQECTRELVPSLQTFDAYLSQNVNQVPTEECPKNGPRRALGRAWARGASSEKKRGRVKNPPPRGQFAQIPGQLSGR